MTVEGCQLDSECFITANRCENGNCVCGHESESCSGTSRWCLSMDGTTAIPAASEAKCQV